MHYESLERKLELRHMAKTRLVQYLRPLEVVELWDLPCHPPQI